MPRVQIEKKKKDLARPYSLDWLVYLVFKDVDSIFLRRLIASSSHFQFPKMRKALDGYKEAMKHISHQNFFMEPFAMERRENRVIA